jgi:deoxyguanosine kinase
MKYKVLISLGSNKGNRKKNLAQALFQINQNLGELIAISPIYETASWGYKDDAYLNNAICLSTSMEPIKLLDALLEIEVKFGRIRSLSKEYQARELDLDIILIEGVVVNHPKLQVPHPRMSARKFVLQPLVDIVPNWEHELLHTSLKELLLNCQDQSEIKLYGTLSLHSS